MSPKVIGTIESISIAPPSIRYRLPAATRGRCHTRTLVVMSPDRTPSRRYFTNSTGQRLRLLPVQRVEDHRKRGVRLPAMLRAEAEEHDAAFAVGHRHRRGLAREVLGAGDPAGQQNIARVFRIGEKHPALQLVAGSGRLEGDGAID